MSLEPTEPRILSRHLASRLSAASGESVLKVFDCGDGRREKIGGSSGFTDGEAIARY